MALVSLLVVALVVSVILLTKRFGRTQEDHHSADFKSLPGPKGLPIIGSVHEIPDKNSWMKFHEWGEKYGPIYQVNLAGSNHVWISRDKIARDLLSKRSGIYSDRPHIPALEQDNRTSGQYLPLMSRNEKWTRQRKFAKQIMDASEKAAFHGYPELESIRLLFELISDPSHYNTAMESFIARVTSRLAWGTAAPSEELKQRARELLIGVSPSGALGNKLPFIMLLPDKFCKAKAWESRRSRTERKFFETMQQEVQDNIDARPSLSTAQPKQSWMRTFLENKTQWKFASDLEGAFAVGMHGIAGALTIAAPMQSFCLAMCHYPQYQSVLHEEIDKVLGDRMPRFSDMPDMPVLRAFIRETLRWRPPVPTGIPHELIQDDIYEGYHIPRGSVIHPLEWSISRDPETFPDPDTWNPLRWLDSEFPTYQEPLSKYPTITEYSQFGYGRRTCQGMGVTEADLFVGLGSVAWLFSFSQHGAVEEKVEESEPAEEAHTEMKQQAEQDLFEENAERVKAQSLHEKAASVISVLTGLDTPPDTPREEEEREAQLDYNMLAHANGKLYTHANDSVISVPGEFPSLPTFDQGMMTPPATPSCPATPSRQSSATPSYFDDVQQPQQQNTAMDAATPSTSSSSPSATTTTTTEQLAIDDDPTMNFSSLLIAKPLPFKFNLRIRNRARAEQVTSKWLQLKMDGEFQDARVYWADGKSTAGNEEFGWGEVFS